MITDKKSIAAVEFDAIPEELKEINAWVLWRAAERTNKDGETYYTKQPLKADGRLASSTNSNTWLTFKEAQEAYESGIGEGVGVILNGQHDLFVLDIDGVTEHDHYEHFKQATYCELSPSGNGIHVYMLGQKPKEHRVWGVNDKSLELFSDEKFVTVTGHMCNDIDYVADLDSHIDHLINNEFPPDEYSLSNVDLSEPLDIDTPKHGLPKDKIMRIMAKSEMKDEIAPLMQGDTSDFDYDHSRADWALCSHLAYWTARDEQMVWDIFTESGLYDPARGKRRLVEQYDQYVKETIRKAVLKKQKVFETQSPGDYEITIQSDGSIMVSEDGSTKNIKKNEWWVRDNPDDNPKFVHHYMSWYVMQNYFIVRYPDTDGDLYIYNAKTGIYEVDKMTRKLRGIIRKLSPNLKDNQVREVRNYVMDMSRVESTENTEYTAVGNGLVRFKDKTFRDFTPEVFVTRKIPTNYNPEAYDEFIDKTINKASSGHEPTIQNIREMFAMIIYPKLLVPKMIYLLGVSANNAKSTTLNMARRALDPGGEISAVSPQKLAGNDFSGSSVYGKMANIVDDLPDIKVTDTGHLKAAITGGYIEIEAKNKGSFSVQMQTPFIIASNHYPKFQEHGTQINKRLHIIPFEYDFLKDDEYISESESMERIGSQNAREYVLKLGIDALADMLTRTKEILTPNDKAQAALDEFSEYNNPLSEYFAFRDREYFEEVPGTEVYSDYKMWADHRMVKSVLEMSKFKITVCDYHNMQWKKNNYKIGNEWKTRYGFKSKK